MLVGINVRQGVHGVLSTCESLSFCNSSASLRIADLGLMSHLTPADAALQRTCADLSLSASAGTGPLLRLLA